MTKSHSTEINVDKILIKYMDPILSDNRNWRSEIPDYNDYFDSIEAELRELPKVDGLVIEPYIVSDVTCSVCGCSDYSQVLNKYGFMYVECEKCSHVYVKNRLRNDKILDDYRSGHNVEKITHQIEQNVKLQEYTNNLYSKYLSLFGELGINEGKIIDIGCGTGNFVSFCVKNTEFEVYANEINEAMYPVLSEIVGNRLIKGPIEEFQTENERFDVVTLWGVLEHLVDPVSVLRNVKNIIDGNGYIFVLIPNINSRAYKLLGARTPTLNPKVHIQMFTENSFKLMCEDVGLKVLKLFGELPIIDLMYDYIYKDDELVTDIMDNNESYYHAYLLQRESI